MSLALAVARRALLLALVALLVAIVALVAALVRDSGDSAEVVDSGQVRADAAAAQESVAEAAALAEASAASTAQGQEAVAAAQAAAAAAQQAAAAAEAAAAQAAAAVEALAGLQAAAAAPAEAETETETEAGSTAEDDDPAGASAETAAEAPDPSAEAADPTAEAAPADGSEQAPADEAVSLPGEPFEIGPPAGAALAVVGVSHDSALNVRDVPNGEIIARLDNVMNVAGEPVVYVREPDSDELIATLDLNRGVIATGNTRRLPTTIWHEIRMGGAVGWASSAYLSPLGATTDATTEIIEALGETPSAPTLAELGRVVAGAVASDEPPSRIVVSGAPAVGDLGEITIDVLGLPDDAVRGVRLHVFANQDSESGSFALKSVESTTICDSHRGASEEGLCN